MIQYSFSTMLMAVLSTNIILLITSLCFCHKSLLVSVGYKMFMLLLGIAFLRCIFPFQFSFTTNIALCAPLSYAVSLFCHTLFTIGSFNISLWTVTELVWLIGIAVNLRQFVKRQSDFHYYVITHSTDITQEGSYSAILDEICGQKPNPFRVLELPGLQIPVLYGMRSPSILVPVGMDISEYDLHYLLSHEAAHYFHRDILVKACLSLMTIIFWWNPACYLLKEQLDAILEMRIDHAVAGDTADTIIDYVNCLISVAAFSPDKTAGGNRKSGSSIALLDSNFYNNLMNRYHILCVKPKPCAKLLHMALLALTVSLYLLSYLYIFEARYIPPNQSATTIEASSENTYAILREDGLYDIYLGDFQVDTVSDLTYYPADMPVFKSLDEVPEELLIHY